MQARPFINRVVNFVTTTEPGLLAEYALGGVAAYYLVRICSAGSRLQLVLLLRGLHVLSLKFSNNIRSVVNSGCHTWCSQSRSTIAMSVPEGS